MRSKEVAELAGVSVRTLRHYHQIGILPEPGRGANGYRTYRLDHVARLLRIRTLAELGVPLERMGPLLDSPDARASEEMLGELAAQLEHRIARLQQQLRRVTELRDTRARPDHSAGLAGLIEALGGAGDSDLAGVEEDASVVVARLFETGGSPDDLRELTAALGGVRSDEQYAALTGRFESLRADAPDHEVRDLVESFNATFGPAITHVIDSTMGGRLRRLRPEALPAVEVDPRLNDAQAEVVRLLGETL